MTREDIKTINDIVHKTIYGFFDICGDEETPMTDKDKLLLEVNKAVCNNIKDFEQEPCDDAISRRAVLDAIDDIDKTACMNEYHAIVKAIEDLPSVTPKPKTGHWIRDTITDLYHCSNCRSICHQDPKSKDDYCKYCGAKMEG